VGNQTQLTVATLTQPKSTENVSKQIDPGNISDTTEKTIRPITIPEAEDLVMSSLKEAIEKKSCLKV